MDPNNPENAKCIGQCYHDNEMWPHAEQWYKLAQTLYKRQAMDDTEQFADELVEITGYLASVRGNTNPPGAADRPAKRIKTRV